MEVILLNVIPRPVQKLYLSNKKSRINEGFVLYADISGFTSVTESLLEQGKTGAEILGGVLNRIFSRSINEIFSSGGVIAEFEGDAIIAVFPINRPEAPLRAAANLKKYFEKESFWGTDSGRWPVSVKLSLAPGQVEWGIIGNDRLTYFIKGSALYKAVQSSKTNEPGTIGVHPDFKDIIKHNHRIKPEEAAAEDFKLKKHSLVRILKSVASKFVSASILSSGLSGEFRSVTPVFINIKSNDDMDFRSNVSKILSFASIYGGDLNGLFCSDPESATALVLFGAPVSWENNTSRAIEFSMKLKNMLRNSIRIGISEGTVYAGITGNSRRCKYTVYGDTVNTVARLVQKAAFGEILITEKAIMNSEHQYGMSNIERWLPRGKYDDILIGTLNNLKNNGIGLSFIGRMLGRSYQKNLLLQNIETVRTSGFAGAVVVFGEAGMGKSRLLFEASREFSPDFQIFVLKCDDILRRSLNPFEYFLKDLFQQDGTRNRTANIKSFRDQMRLIIDNTRLSVPDDNDNSLPDELERASSLIASVLGLFWKDSIYSKLAAESRFDNITLALKTLFKALSRIKPAIFIIEDLQWMDNDSRKVISTITRNVKKYPFIILISSRYYDDGSKPAVPVDQFVDTVSLNLTGIDRESTSGVIVNRLGLEPSEKLVDFIFSSSSGNPFYIEQFCYYLRESGLMFENSGKLNLSSGEFSIPSGIKSILVARMDRLPDDVRKFLQTASILGQEFNVDTLNLISGIKGSRKLLNDGQRLQLWSRQSDSMFAFNHALYRNTAYGMLLGKNLHKLHTKAAEVLIKINSENPEPVAGKIALHLKESLQISRAINWGWKALCHAMDTYRNYDVLKWSDRLKDWMISESSPDKELLLDVLLKKNSVLHSLGNRQEQRENIELMTAICKKENLTHRTAEVLKARGALEWSTGDIDTAFSLFEKGLEITDESPDTSIKGKLLGNIANLYAAKGRNTEAREYYYRALEFHRNSGNHKQEGVTLGNLAILFRRNGNEDQARECYEKALALHREAGNRIGEGRILCGLGNLEEKPEGALKYYRDALKINREIGDRRNEAIILSNLGRIETIQEKFDKSAEYLNQALTIHRQIGNSTGEADTHCLFGEMFHSMSKWDEARIHFIKAIDISGKAGNSWKECIYQGLLGLVNFEDGRIKDAITNYLNTYELIMDSQFPSSIDDSIDMLRKKLLSEGISESDLPFPEHW